MLPVANGESMLDGGVDDARRAELSPADRESEPMSSNATYRCAELARGRRLAW